MLLDSNIIIYATNDNKLLKIISEYEILNSSLITNIEVLGFHKISEPKKKELEGFFNSINILEVSNPIADKAISLRQIKNISLGDSIAGAHLRRR